MSVNNKHLATLLLGAAAAFGAYKYMNLSDEEKEKLATSLKDKANKLKNSALDAEDKATAYFDELKTKGSDALKEHFPNVDEFLSNLFKGSSKPNTSTTAGTSTDGAPTM